MGLKTVSLVICSLAALGAGLAIAQDAAAPMSAEEAYAARVELMKSNGATMRGAAELTGEPAIAAMTTMVSNFQTIPSLFPEGSIVDKSRALPAIWEDFEAFTAIAESGAAAAQTALDAATAGDNAAYMAAVEQIGQACGTCHQTYRGE
ncbi:c-type cytochrome [Devosia sp. XGJD_8]|jgi:cytochrome c556|uniref:c-type cytochrome n=1 Tax=Devosia sp. XGJD_8 TaxID=3391187 RepID=UPI00398513D6